MNAKLYREDAETSDTDISWSHVGPLHERAYFNLISLVGYAPSIGDKPPFHIYNTYKWHGQEMPPNSYLTIPAAKRAGRSWIKQWISECEGKSVEWTALETGVHFAAHVHGMQIANYYFCPEPRDTWHKGFRVWFGGTYYVTEFANPDEAMSAVSQTYDKWISNARRALLVVKG